MFFIPLVTTLGVIFESWCRLDIRFRKKNQYKLGYDIATVKMISERKIINVLICKQVKFTKNFNAKFYLSCT